MGQPSGLASGILPLPLPHDGGLRAGEHLPGHPYHHDCGADCPEAASAGAVSICRVFANNCGIVLGAIPLFSFDISD